MNNYANYLYIAIRAALDAGKAIMDIYTDPESDFGIERKADNSPLTKADKKAHAIISMALSVTPFPVLSEEGKEKPFAERSGWDMLWIVDPLDGTKEFIKKNGEFTVNIALVKEGVPVDYGYQPSMDEIKTKAIRLPMPMGHQGVVVVASRSHQTEETTAFIENLRKQGQPVTLISSGSSLKICLVAEGTADVYPRFAPTMEWDTAAGHAIARAAGCEVYHIDGKTPLKYNKEDLHNPWFIVKPL